MSTLTNIFYITSISLMIPVMLALLFGLLYAVYLTGTTIYEYVGRMRQRAARRAFTEALEAKSSSLPAFDATDDFSRTLNYVMADSKDSLLLGKRIADQEAAWRTELEKVHDLTKYGPAFGLMGTLIPLGPALVGLADGNLKMMADNMIVAFATTIVGILISLIALTIHSAKKRWYRADSILLTFAAERLAEMPTPTESQVSDAA